MIMCAWEQKKNLDLVIGILHTQTVDINMIFNTLTLERPGWKSQVIFESDRPYDISRNNIATRCLELGAEWCFFYDSDLIIPPNTITRLASHNLPIVGGLYYRRHPEIVPTVFRDVGKGVLSPIPKKEIDMMSPISTLIEVDAIGAGCLLIHRKVFEALKNKVPLRQIKILGPPAGNMHFYEFFHWGLGREEDPDQPSYSEDLSFCTLARKNGFKIFVDTIVKCTHITHMGIKDGQVQWLPLDGG
jgi:hypothetical protein